VPALASSIEEHLQRLQELAQAAVDDELPSAPQWINDASLDALDKIRVLRAAARVNLALIPVGENLRAHLGENWVDLHEEIYKLVKSSAHWHDSDQ
jgi:hypothetical protein